MGPADDTCGIDELAQRRAKRAQQLQPDAAREAARAKLHEQWLNAAADLYEAQLNEEAFACGCGGVRVGHFHVQVEVADDVDPTKFLVHTTVSQPIDLAELEAPAT